MTNQVFSLFEKYGNEDYLGENVTQLEHAIQCAMLAEKEDGSTEVYGYIHIQCTSDIRDTLGQGQLLPIAVVSIFLK